MARSETGFSGGLQIPIQPDQAGGFRVIEGDDYVSQLIMTLASDGDSDNPFFKMGLGLEAVFANLSEGAWRAQQQRRIVEVFNRLSSQKIARLVGTQFTAGPGQGEFTIGIKFLSVETATERDVQITTRRK